MDPESNDIMTLEEVAAYLRLKPQTIYTWAQEKRIPAAKLDTVIGSKSKAFISKDSILKWDDIGIS